MTIYREEDLAPEVPDDDDLLLPGEHPGQEYLDAFARREVERKAAEAEVENGNGKAENAERKRAAKAAVAAGKCPTCGASGDERCKRPNGDLLNRGDQHKGRPS